MFYDLLEGVLILDDETAGLLFKSIIEYEFYNKKPDSICDEPYSDLLWRMAIKQIDYGKENFISKFGDKNGR